MRASVRGLGVLVLLMSAGCESAAVVTAPTMVLQTAQLQAGYLIPPGTSTLAYSTDAGPSVLIFGGSPDLRIVRVITASGIDIEFASASPQQATKFFRDNPLPGAEGMTIEVNNPTDRSIHLSVNSMESRRKP